MYRFVLVFIFLISIVNAYEESKGTAGYGRLQTSLQDGKETLCFKLPGASTKYRLGNECESWIEIAVFQDIKLDNGIRIHTQVRPAFLSENEQSIEFLRWEEFYTEVFNLIDSNEVSLWAGRRYYKRYDSHISDYFFFNMSGTGFGINNYSIYKDMTLSYSYMYDRLKDDSFVGGEELLFNSHDVRLAKKYDGGDITLFLNYMHFSDKSFQSGDSIDGANGFAIGLINRDNNILYKLFGLKGENIAGIFYGNGAAKGAGSNSPYLQDGIIQTMLDNNSKIDDAQTLRLINYNAMENDTFGIMSNIVYEKHDEKKFANTKLDWFSFGLRSYWFIHKNTRLAFELGFDKVHDKISSTDHHLSKFSSALEFAFDKGVWERPVLRLYHTYAKWSDGASVASDYYLNSTDGNNIGVQIEYWW